MINEIRERWAKVRQEGGRTFIEVVGSDAAIQIFTAAPEDIAWLLARVEELEKAQKCECGRDLGPGYCSICDNDE